jgi:hypothetical protein
MNFVDIQDNVRDAIKASPTFTAQAATTVCSDNGDKKTFKEDALQNSGYSVSVWPPTRGMSNQDEDAVVGVNAVIVVRLELNPTKLAAIEAAHVATPSDPTQGNFINTKVAAIIKAVLRIDPLPAAVRFALAADAFELITFDEGLVAYHIRFTRFTTFGS